MWIITLIKSQCLNAIFVTNAKNVITCSKRISSSRSQCHCLQFLLGLIVYNIWKCNTHSNNNINKQTTTKNKNTNTNNVIFSYNS